MSRAILAAMLVVSIAACTSGSGGSGDEKKKPLIDLKAIETSLPMTEARDGLLVLAVKSRLAAADIDTATNVKVRAAGGAVTLEGPVHDAAEIKRLGDAAAGVSGVRSVTSKLRVDSGLRHTSAKLGDVALATTVAANLAVQTGINALRVKTSASDGAVTISGHVQSAAVKSLMLTTASHTHGVRSVVDRIELTP